MKSRCVLLVSAALLLALSCDKTGKEEDVKAEIKVPAESQAVFSSGLSFDETAQTAPVTFTATQAWHADVPSGWLSVQPASGSAGTVKMTVSAQANPEETPRNTQVTITCGSVSKAFTVNQAGAPPVVIAVTSVTLDKTALTLTKGQSETLTATVAPENATDKTLSWTSSDTAVASVDQSGKVSALKSGTATITAKAGSQSASCTVTVLEPLVTVSVSGRINGLSVPESIKGIVPETLWASGLEISLLCNDTVYRYTADEAGATSAFSPVQETLQAREGDHVYAIAPAQTITGSSVPLSNHLLPLEGNDLSPLPLMTLWGAGVVHNGQVELVFESIYAYIVVAMTGEDIKLFPEGEYLRVAIPDYRVSDEHFLFDLVSQSITGTAWTPYSDFSEISNVLTDGKSYTYFPILPGSIGDADLSLYTGPGYIAWSKHFSQLDFQSNNVYLIDFDKSTIEGAGGSFKDVPIISW